MKTVRWYVIGMLICLVAVGGKTFAQQKFGYVNSQTILEQLPEAQEAQKKINAIIQVPGYPGKNAKRSPIEVGRLSETTGNDD